MRVLGIMLSLAIRAFVVYVAVTFYLDFRKVPGTTTERLLIAARDSATVLWAKFCILVAGITSQIDNLADLFGAPEAKDFINAWVGNPKMIAALMLAISLITIKARTRTL